RFKRMGCLYPRIRIWAREATVVCQTAECVPSVAPRGEDVARIPVWIRASSADNIDTDGLSPEMIAYLYGGTKRAVLAALGSLRSQSLVTGKSEKIRLDPHARPDDGSTALERAILGEAFLSTRYSQLLYAGPFRWATIQMDKELVDRGLLLTQRQRAMMSRCESTLGMGLRVGDHVVDQQVTQPVPSRRR
ncbi:MAG: TIGR04222 domain-containing membrane protein, partial [Pseudonocardia sp.]|nr:TIGR04222 domain-containing membrane protein [Pseudonocardia sp.]